MQNVLETLKEVLKQDQRLVVEGKLVKNKIVELGLKLDAGLLGLLLKEDELRDRFFQKVNDVYVFDKQYFQHFISNKEFLADSYTSFKNKIGLSIDHSYLADSKEVVLNWPYKDCVLEGGQTKEDAGRKEIFWNKTLAPDQIDRLLDPKVFSNFKRYGKDGKSEVSQLTINDNYIIKGNNLLTLASLRKVYRDKIRVIYIDPPYNTGGGGDTFSYNNRFKRSTWLTFMKNRLEIAKELLTDDGVLITAIDDNEFATLRLLLEELFPGYTHQTVVVDHHPQGSGGKNISTTHEYAIFTFPEGKEVIKGEHIEETEEHWSLIKSGAGDDYYRVGRPNMFFAIHVDKETSRVIGVGPELKVDENYKTKDTGEGWARIYPFDGSGDERRWRYNRETMKKLIDKGDIICSANGKYTLKVRKVRRDVYKPLYSNWTDKKYNAGTHGSRLIEEILGGKKFSFPKSLHTVKDAIKSVVQDDKEAIILDYHAGSGTTAHAVMDLNEEDGGKRSFILCEQMDYIQEVTCERVKKVIENKGQGSFIYTELKEFNQAFRQQIISAKSYGELSNIWSDMKDNAFLSFRVDIQNFDEHVSEFEDLSFEDQKKFLTETLDQNQLYVNYSEIDNEDFDISEAEKRLNREFYSLK